MQPSPQPRAALSPRGTQSQTLDSGNSFINFSADVSFQYLKGQEKLSKIFRNKRNLELLREKREEQN